MFKATFISNIKRWWWIPALDAALLLLSFAARMFYTYADTVFELEEQLILTYVTAALCGVMLFSFLHSYKSAGFYYSLPSKKSSIFLANLIFGLLSVLLCTIIFIFAFIIYKGTYNNLLHDSFLVLSYTMIIFAMSVFASMFTGNILAAGIFTVVFLLLPAYIEETLYNLTNQLYGFISYYTISIDWLYGSDNPITGFGVTLVLLLAAFTAYRLRPAETAGELVSFRRVQTLFIQGAALCVGLLLSGTFHSSDTNYLVLAIAGLITAAAAMMLMQKTFRIKGYPLQAGIFVVIVALLYAFIPMDITGYENRVPAAEDVASVTVSDAPNNRYMFANHYNSFSLYAILDTPEDIAAAVRAHDKIVSEKFSNEDYDYRYHFSDISIHYELKNGKTLDRYYSMIPIEYIDDIIGSEPFRRSYFRLDEEWTDVQLHIGLDNINYKYVMLLPEEITALRAAVETDALSCAPKDLYDKYYYDSKERQSEEVYLTYSLSDGSNEYEQKYAITVNENMPTAWPLLKELMQKHGESADGEVHSQKIVKAE